MAELDYFPETAKSYARIHVNGSPSEKSGRIRQGSDYWVILRHGTFSKLRRATHCNKLWTGYFVLPEELWDTDDHEIMLNKAADYLEHLWRFTNSGAVRVFHEETESHYSRLYITRPPNRGYFIILRGRSFSKTRNFEDSRKDNLEYFELPPQLWVNDDPETLLKMAVGHLRDQWRRKGPPVKGSSGKSSKGFKMW